MFHSTPAIPSGDEFDVELTTRVRLAVRPTGPGWGPRRLGHYAFFWILEGHSQWVVDGAAHRLEPGMLGLVRPGMRDEFRWDAQRPSAHGYVGFRIRNPERLPDPESWPLLVSLPHDDVVRPLLRHVAWLTEERPAEWTRLVATAMRLAVLAFATGNVRAGGEGHGAGSEAVDRVIRFMRTRWSAGNAEPPTLRELARVASVSPGYLCRLFKRHHGCGPIEAIRVLRLEAGAELLRHSRLPVREVAIRTGFDDPLYFTRRFARMYGLAPSAYRTLFLRGEPLSGPIASNLRGLGHLAESLQSMVRD